MSFLDWLRRLGILRFGGEVGLYHNAVERPLSLQMGDVFDSQKDVSDLSTGGSQIAHSARGPFIGAASLRSSRFWPMDTRLLGDITGAVSHGAEEMGGIPGETKLQHQG